MVNSPASRRPTDYGANLTRNYFISFTEHPGCATVDGVVPAVSLEEGSDTAMNAPPVGVERRIGQRFPFNVPVSLRDASTAAEGLGFTQDLSSRGAFLFTDMALTEGANIELTLKMPSEITLGESMRVRCQARVLRIVKPIDNSNSVDVRSAETKIGVAVCLSGYEYLPDTDEGSADYRRISALHSSSESEPPASPTTAGSRAAH
jgi:hypothetical protein